MISTVTTAVSAIVSSSTVGGLLGSLGMAAVFTLIVTLAVKEMATHGTSLRVFSHNLGIIIIPLLFVFFFILSTQIVALLLK